MSENTFARRAEKIVVPADDKYFRDLNDFMPKRFQMIIKIRVI